MRYRRYLFGKRKQAEVESRRGVASAYRTQQEARPGNPLPAGFILTTQLATAGYTTVDDLDGATVSELTSVGFSKSEAAAILSAAQNLVPAVP